MMDAGTVNIMIETILELMVVILLIILAFVVGRIRL